MSHTLITILMLAASNVFMTFAWHAQPKLMQEVITLAVFAPFAIFYMKFRLDWNYLWAALCMVCAVFFIMRSR